MSEGKNNINKAFILAGGKGKRIQLNRKQNLKAFIEIDNEQLLIRHIRQIQEYLNPKQTYIVITEYEDLFRESIKKFDNVRLIFNSETTNLRGLELLFAIKTVNAYLNQNEKALVTLVDEYYDDDDFQKFCHSLFKGDFTTMAAIKELTFPEEYLKNYAVVINKEKGLITNSIEKSRNIISNYFSYICKMENI